MKQPTPQVTFDDVDRIVRRDFVNDEYDAAMAILSEYGTEKWHRERERVQLAALNTANSDIQRLRSCIESAKLDYRDILIAAEFPMYGRVGWTRLRNLSPEEERSIIDGDWRQYDEWLKRPA